MLKMKICSKCRIPKLEEEFLFVFPAKMNGKRRPDCRVCKRATNKVHHQKNPELAKARWRKNNPLARARNRAYVIEFLSVHSCVDCGNADLRVLEFDHVRGEKSYDVSRLVCSGARLWRLKNEIEKCEIRCANCHRIKTAQQAGWWLRDAGT
jgi:hypothetical protein